ncbi:Six-hairpin glycosidase-like protein [Xylariaceae sp. FL0016]|nr:Six-hairpin glycosidase-like protein [Xylariaceae sp. FL0016]
MAKGRNASKMISAVSLSLLILSLVFLASSVCASESDGGIDFRHLPNHTAYPGPWERYIKAPVDKKYVIPERIWKVEGNVSMMGMVADELWECHTDGRKCGGGGGGEDDDEDTGEEGILIGEGGFLTVAFKENIAGRVCINISAAIDNPIVKLAYSESHFFVGEKSDATNDEAWDEPLSLHIRNLTGKVCVATEFNRGAFKYLTVYIDVIPVLGSQNTEVGDSGRSLYTKPSIKLSNIWVNSTSFPSQSSGRAYTGCFSSSSDLLNRIWYAGAYTLQLCTIPPNEGSALIPVNQDWDHNTSPPGSWYNNFTISDGTTVLTDGAKRDRVVWPGDLVIAVPGVAVSTFDMMAVRNALDVLLEHVYDDGRLPYAGPPLGMRGEFSDTYHMHTLLGMYDYVLYSGDVAWLTKRWTLYKRALETSTAKVEDEDLMRVHSPFDWNRKGMQGHNGEASAILYHVLRRSIELAEWLQLDQNTAIQWKELMHRLERGITKLYCSETNLYSDNLDGRHCNGIDHVDPQDGNSWVLISGVNHLASPHIKQGVSEALRKRWNAFGAPAPEFPNVMSPFASGFELQAHCMAGFPDNAVELILLMWGYLLDGPGFTNSTLAEGFRTDGYVHYPAYPVPSRNSHAHGWSTGPTSVLMNHIIGITLLRPGGETWAFRPVLTKWLGWARGGFATGRGKFEGCIWRVVLRDNTEGMDKRKGIIAAVHAPEGTKGSFGWVGQSQGEHAYSSAVLGGDEWKAWIRWEDEAAETEEIHVGTSMEYPEDAWYRREIQFKGGQVLVYDDGWTEPAMQERGPGDVDWEAIGQGYKWNVAWAPLSGCFLDPAAVGTWDVPALP